MNASESLFSLSVPLGRFLGTRVRLSAFMLIVILAVVWRVQELTTSVLVGAVWFLSVCLHETMNLLVMHRIRLHCPERILWPFGGLFSEAPARSIPSVSLAGLGVNVAIVLAAASQLDVNSDLPMLLNPATCWQAIQSDDTLKLLLRASFLVNTLIVVANLIPVRPMVGGYVLQGLLLRRLSVLETHDVLLRSGLVMTIFGALSGFVFDLSGPAALAAFLLLLHIQEAVRWVQPALRKLDHNRHDVYSDYGDPQRESGAFDFSDEDPPDGITDRWNDRRESERDQRDRELEQHENAELDRVLEKLHTHGRNSLTVAELHLLNRVSAKLRQKNHQ